jgi:hypothetical protein
MSGRPRNVVAAIVASLFVTSVAFGALLGVEFLLSERIVALLESFGVVARDWGATHPETIAIICILIAAIPTAWFAWFFYLRSLHAEQAVERGEI